MAMFSLWIVTLVLAVAGILKRLRSPLVHIPGPRITAVTSILLKFHEFTSNRRLFIHRLHQQYGPVVRIGPSEVSFSSLDAMREIYMSGGSGYDKTEFYHLFAQFGRR